MLHSRRWFFIIVYAVSRSAFLLHHFETEAKLYRVRPPKVHHLDLNDHRTKLCFIFSNQINSCRNKTNYTVEQIRRFITTTFLQSFCCRHYMCSLIFALVKTKLFTLTSYLSFLDMWWVFEVIGMSFLLAGHTSELAHRAFGRTSERLKCEDDATFVDFHNVLERPNAVYLCVHYINLILNLSSLCSHEPAF